MPKQLAASTPAKVRGLAWLKPSSPKSVTGRQPDGSPGGWPTGIVDLAPPLSGSRSELRYLNRPSGPRELALRCGGPVLVYVMNLSARGGNAEAPPGCSGRFTTTPSASHALSVRRNSGRSEAISLFTRTFEGETSIDTLYGPLPR